jgi:alpha-galactosidase
MPKAKISIIGAGSAVFSLQLISDLCKTDSLAGSTVCLMDVDPERLENVHFLSTRLVEEFGADLQFHKTTDLEEAVIGADFVINTALAGGHGFLEKVRAIGEKYGYYRGIDAQEFNMVSDYYTLSNWNQLSFFMHLARLIEEKAPNAWLLLAANPVFEGTTLISRHTKVKMVGFCHGHYDVDVIARCAGYSMNEIDWQVAGVNHGIWLTRFRKDEKDLYGSLEKWETQHPGWKPETPFDLQLSPAAFDMYRFYGRMPIGDTVRNSSWEYHFSEETKKKWYGEPWGGADAPAGWVWYENKLAAIVAIIKQLTSALKTHPELRLSWLIETRKRDVPKEFLEQAERIMDPEVLSGEQHVPFIAAITGNRTERLVVNVLNRGYVKNLPDNIAVEIPASVDIEGIHPESLSPELPDRIARWYLMPRILRMEWALEAFLTKDTGLLVEFLMRDPRTKSQEQAEAVIKELFTN